MNANELIESYKSVLKDIKSVKELYGERAKDVKRDIKNVDKFIDELESTISILSRYRVRNTAAEPPTEEDGGTGNHARYVMARENKHDFWEEIELAWVANNPDEYPQWTCVPEFEGGKDERD